jgi:hypothetical protein|tara:strand:+ start:199 stop:417 length:219 start_codon:yes stop_codon:yes gene_type:complete
MTKLPFNRELDYLIEQMMDLETSKEDRFETALQAIGLLVMRIEDLQGFVLKEGLTITDFNEYMEGQSDVIYH